jgi:23S rRNA U2552 (ribose-2'-O)-methylase RlmE/FtsJ
VQPPKGVSTIQGNFLSPAVQEEVRSYVQDPTRGRLKKRGIVSQTDDEPEEELEKEELEEAERSYLDSERHAHLDTSTDTLHPGEHMEVKKLTLKQRDMENGRVVDVVLSDMSAPWEQTTALWVKSVSNPYHRMMNTSGISFKDHAGSMVCSLFLFCSPPGELLLTKRVQRISAWLPLHSASIPSEPADTLSANTTKAMRRKTSSYGSRSSSKRFTGRNQSHLETYVLSILTTKFSCGL